MEKLFCTIMTPTYNRGYIIKNLYSSLKAQSTLNFEWIVIDDGSIDNTETIFINEIIPNEDDFKIYYYKTKNGGKHRAINYALKKANGNLFFIVDSDDILPPSSIQTIYQLFSTLDKNKESFAGIGGLKGYLNSSKVIGSTFEGDYFDCQSNLRIKNNIIGDKAEVFYTDILRKYPFPEFENEFFLSEDVVWMKIAFDGYKIRWFNKIIYLADYLSDGLTYNLFENYKKSPLGFFTYLNTLLLYTDISILRRYYYYGLFYGLTDKNIYTITKTQELFQCKRIEIMIGYILYKLKQLIKGRFKR